MGLHKITTGSALLRNKFHKDNTNTYCNLKKKKSEHKQGGAESKGERLSSGLSSRAPRRPQDAEIMMRAEIKSQCLTHCYTQCLSPDSY